MTGEISPGEYGPAAVELLDRITSAKVPAGTVAMWWVGQEGWIIRGGGLTLAIDPFLSDFGHFGRAYLPPLDPRSITSLDLLLGTHNHADHIDPISFPQLLDASPQALGVVPAAVIDEVVAFDVARERLRGLVADEILEHGSIRITAIPAVHADAPEKGYDFHLDDQGRGRFLGYVLEIDGVRICHTGDTLPYPGLVERLRPLQLDLLMLPINGISSFRHERQIAGNMNTFEAAELADLVQPRLTIPMHYDMFAGNAELPGHLVTYSERFHPTVQILVPALGRRIDIVGGH
ncbi:MAG: MBL fold metallo-hydrolase [Candidatus Dormibacteria bacterium]